MLRSFQLHNLQSLLLDDAWGGRGEGPGLTERMPIPNGVISPKSAAPAGRRGCSRGAEPRSSGPPPDHDSSADSMVHT